MIRSAQRVQGKPTRASRIASELKSAILAGELAPGEKVNLDQLRNRYGVSLSPMREAISRLVADGLVTLEDQRGYRIAAVSASDLTDITRMRADIEALALSYAIARAGLDWESDVLAAQHRLARAKSSEDHDAAHLAFHATLAKGCGMPLLQSFCDVLANQHLRYLKLVKADEAANPQSDEHGAIAEAAVSRDTEMATALLRRHIERTGAELSQKLANTDRPY